MCIRDRNGRYAQGGQAADDFIYVALNMHWDAHHFELPRLPDGMHWHVFANTGVESPADVWEPGHEPRLDDQSGILVGSRSVVIIVGR